MQVVCSGPHGCSFLATMGLERVPGACQPFSLPKDGQQLVTLGTGLSSEKKRLQCSQPLQQRGWP